MAGLLDRWRKYRRHKLLERVLIPDALWQRIVRSRLERYRLSETETARLRELASLFLDAKTISGVGLEPSEYQRCVIAALASLPVLELDLDWYDDWREVILYPDTFIVPYAEVDETGVVHEEVRELGGESWGRGPVILSWEDIEWQGEEGFNVVLHEFAHKLDMRGGDANGMPPLHRGMDRARWTTVFQQAFDDLGRLADRDAPAWMDPYGAESPAEFFAVASEAFFEIPLELDRAQPELYDQLRRFYRQDPAARLDPAGYSS